MTSVMQNVDEIAKYLTVMMGEDAEALSEERMGTFRRLAADLYDQVSLARLLAYENAANLLLDAHDKLQMTHGDSPAVQMVSEASEIVAQCGIDEYDKLTGALDVPDNIPSDIT